MKHSFIIVVLKLPIKYSDEFLKFPVVSHVLFAAWAIPDHSEGFPKCTVDLWGCVIQVFLCVPDIVHIYLCGQRFSPLKGALALGSPESSCLLVD